MIDLNEIRQRVGEIRDKMDEDSGEAECEPFTTWCQKLSLDVLALLDYIDEQEKTHHG